MLPRVFPPPFPGAADDSVVIPDTRGPHRFLVSLLWQQRALLAATAAVVVLWQVPNALLPWLLGRAIDAGVVAHDVGATLGWAAALFAVVCLGVIGGIASHTAAVSGWLVAMYRTTGLTVRQSLRLGHVLGRRTPTGELLSVSSSDSDTFGACAVNLPMAFGAIVGLATTVAVVMPLNWRMGLVVLLAAPVMVFGAAPLLRPLGEARSLERARSSTLTGQATDIVAGLRILRGIGGEKTFGDNYARQSQTVKKASLTAAAWQAGVDALAIALSGLVIVLLTWLGVGEMDAGRLDVGGLVTFFGYAVFLVGPVQTIFMFTQRWVQGLVSAAKTIGVLQQAAPWPRPTDPQPWPARGVLEDVASGFVAQPGQFTVVVSATPDDSAALADRLGRYLPSDASERAPELDEELKGRARRKDAAAKAKLRAEIAAADAERARQPWGVTVGGIDLARLPIEDIRSHIHVSDANATLFAGTVQDALDPWHRATRQQAEAALVASSALDVFEALPDGWATHLDERGRGLSGGQRQRLVLARALLADPEVLVLVEPTSAVDAHTEAQIASRLVAARAGRTTVVTSASPLLLRHADAVVLLTGGRALARGTHAELMASHPDYRAIVTRGDQEQA